MFKKIFYLSIFIITNVVIVIAFLHRIIKDLFGVVTFEQIIFNINNTGGALEPSMYGPIAFWGGISYCIYYSFADIY